MNVTFDKCDIEDFDRKEIRRYMGDRNQNILIDNVIDECISDCRQAFDYRVCYEIFDVKINDNTVDFGQFRVCSRNLADNFKGCNKSVIFAATVGMKIDRLVRTYSNISPVKSLCFNAIGAERIEALCDKFNDIAKEKYDYTRPRFSPGYGDLDISFQKDIFNILSCEANIGLFISDSLQMVPSKSVTALIGVNDENN